MMISSNGGSRFSTVALLLGFVIILALVAGCGDGKEIIKYKDRPAVVSLVYPSTNLFVTVNPTFYWNRSADAVRYELQVATASDFVNKTIDIQTADTAYTTQSTIPNSTYYWRVRGQNLDGLWGDWSDAEIRAFFKSDYINYFELISQTETMGTPQDLFLRNDTAYIADGQADLTIFDVSNPLSPFLIRNIDPNDDDFAKGVYVSPNDTFPYAFVADMDGKIQALHVQDTTFLLNQSFGTDQNLEDVTGLIVNDTLWVLAVSSGFNRRKLSFYQIIYTPYVDPWGSQNFFSIDMPADANGLCTDGNYVYVACGTSGLRIFDISNIFDPLLISSLALSGSALSVDVEGDYVYVAADRGGLYVINVADRHNPVIAEEVNTSGRTKDVQVIDNFVFIADSDGGLKVIDATVPDSAHFVAAYVTPYAYGLAVTREYIYVCDRDLGLMIFENRISQ